MKHITESYGEPCNHLEMKVEDFYILRDFLRAAGADIRMMTMYAGTCTVQIRNDGEPWDPWDKDKMGPKK